MDWMALYEDEAFGEERADLRQMVLLDHLVAMFTKHTPVSELMWPYFGEGVDPAKELAWMKEADKALVRKEGGGWEWTEPVEKVAERAGKKADAKPQQPQTLA